MTSARTIVLGIIARASRVLRRTPLARSRWLNRLQSRLVVWLHGSTVMRMGEFRVRVHPQERVLSKRLILYGGHEQRELALLCSLVRKGDTVMDIGANVGLYSLHLSRAVGPKGRVLSVEPDPQNLELLRENLASNRCENVDVLPYALGSHSGTVELFQVEGHRGNLSLADLQHTGTSVSVEMRTGRELLEDLGSTPRVIKMDVEGNEPDTFAGLGYLPPVMLFEFVPAQIEALGNDPRQFLESLTGAGYALETVHPDSGERLQEGIDDLMQRGQAGDRVYNVLARLRDPA